MLKYPVKNSAGQWLILLIAAAGLLHADRASAYLHSHTGRFMHRDSWMADDAKPSPGDGYQDGMNRYQYLDSHPNKYLDPFGTDILGKIVCDGNGGFMVQYNPDGDPDVEEKLAKSCIRDIVEAHEGIHLDDWKREHPNGCKKYNHPQAKPRAARAKPLARPSSKHGPFIRESEKRAWADSLSRMVAYRENHCYAPCGNATPPKAPDGVSDDENGQCCEWINKNIAHATEMADTGTYE